MPKLKTHKGTAKRFTITKSGKIKLSHAGKRHILTKKSSKRKRQLGKTGYLKKCNTYSIKTLI